MGMNEKVSGLRGWVSNWRGREIGREGGKPVREGVRRERLTR